MREDLEPQCQQMLALLVECVPELEDVLGSDGNPHCLWCHEPEKQDVHFQNAAEEKFAQILDACHLRWEYEPTEFSLARDSSGTVTSAFRPDFYLSDYGFWIEFTVLEQSLITKKHKKIRLTREMHNVRIELVNRSKFLALIDRMPDENFCLPVDPAKSKNS